MGFFDEKNIRIPIDLSLVSDRLNPWQQPPPTPPQWTSSPLTNPKRNGLRLTPNTVCTSLSLRSTLYTSQAEPWLTSARDWQSVSSKEQTGHPMLGNCALTMSTNTDLDAWDLGATSWKTMTGASAYHQRWWMSWTHWGTAPMISESLWNSKGKDCPPLTRGWAFFA